MQTKERKKQREKKIVIFFPWKKGKVGKSQKKIFLSDKSKITSNRED